MQNTTGILLIHFNNLGKINIFTILTLPINEYESLEMSFKKVTYTFFNKGLEYLLLDLSIPSLQIFQCSFK